MECSSRPPIEAEITLVVCSENTASVFGEIADLTRIGEFLVKKAGSSRIRDSYFDTAGGALRNQGWGLRIREIGSRRWIALKGPPEGTEWGGLRRIEIESPWSMDGLNRILQQLAKLEINISSAGEPVHLSDPRATMIGLELKMIQDRVTMRDVRNIFSSIEEAGPMSAEMALDSVAYQFHGRGLIHYEVEIEAVSSESPRVIPRVVDGLIAAYGIALHRWEHSKLATGWAIERLLKEEDIEKLAPDNRLTREAYDRIEELLG